MFGWRVLAAQQSGRVCPAVEPQIQVSAARDFHCGNPRDGRKISGDFLSNDTRRFPQLARQMERDRQRKFAERALLGLLDVDRRHIGDSRCEMGSYLFTNAAFYYCKHKLHRNRRQPTLRLWRLLRFASSQLNARATPRADAHQQGPVQRPFNPLQRKGREFHQSKTIMVRN